MSNCGTPLCLSPKEAKRNNVILRVPEEMINYTPLESLKIPKNNKIRQSFSKFLCGNINQCEFVKYKCFPSTYDVPTQTVKKIRNRHEDLTLQLKKQAASEKAKQRWRKLAEVIHQNIQLRRQLESNYQTTKIISRIELGMKIQNSLNSNDLNEDLQSYQLRTMTILKEKNKKQNQSYFIPPKHYHFTLQEYFKESADEYLLIYRKNLPNSKFLSDKEYNQLLYTYLNKQFLFEQYKEEIKLRKIVKWRQFNSASTFYSSTMSCQSNGLNKDRPMQRLKNPLSSQQQQRQKEQNLIHNINDFQNPKMATSVKSKKYLRSTNISQKKLGVVKHNRIQSCDLIDNDDDDGLDMSNASITEALLDQLYVGSYKLQQKLKSQTQIQKKVRDILRLQEMKVNTINANYQKLNKYQQKHQ